MLLAGGMPFVGMQLNAAPAPAEQSQTVATINGTILDENNEPVIGASIAQKGQPKNVHAPVLRELFCGAMLVRKKQSSIACLLHF